MVHYHEGLFNEAVREVCIVSGELGTRNSLYPDKYIAAIEGALDRDVEVKIISGPLIDDDSTLLPFLKIDPRVQLYKLSYRPEQHFRMRDVDKKGKEGKLFIEEAHAIFEEAKRTYGTTQQRLLKDYRRLFDSLQRKSIPTTIDDFKIIKLLQT